mgnify:CR=1 FL=1
MLLEVKDIQVYYGAIHAIKGVSFEVNEGEIVTLIGANGAGKSTTLNTVAGLLKPRSGQDDDARHHCGTSPQPRRRHRFSGREHCAQGAPPDRQGRSGARPGGTARVRADDRGGKP